tara:strand:+ start:1233 stop:1631 length:399 start_codon:yes stop_codon:yes gene_type:complete
MYYSNIINVISVGIITSFFCINKENIDKFNDKYDDLKIENNKLEKEIVELKKNVFDISLTNIDNEQSYKILLKQIELLNCKVDNNKIDSNYLVESYEKLLMNINKNEKELDTDNDEYFESLENDTIEKLKKC